jgi:hypothetical protein
MYQIGGDAPDPAGTGLLGHTSQVNVGNAGKIGIAMIRYGDVVLEADVYRVGTEPTRVIMHCPRCRHVVTIQGQHKRIDYAPPAPGLEAQGGSISIERFTCPWELTDQKELGGELCRLRVAVDNNIAREV